MTGGASNSIHLERGWGSYNLIFSLDTSAYKFCPECFLCKRVLNIYLSLSYETWDNLAQAFICTILSSTALYLSTIGTDMFENIVYAGLGFAAAFLALELAWHFTACKIHDRTMKPCFYKQIGLLK